MLTAAGALAGFAVGLLLHRAAALLLRERPAMVAGAPLTAAATAALWLLAAAMAPRPAWLAYAWAVAALAVLITVTDLRRRTIPNAALAAGAALWVPLWVIARPGSLDGAVLGALVFAAPLGLAAWLRPGGMGFGDVKLAAVLGLYLGFPLAVVGLLLGVLAGGFGGVAVLLHPAGGRQGTMPYGPFLAAGAMAALVWGGSLLRLSGLG